MTGLKQTPHIHYTTHCTNPPKYHIHILHEHPRHHTNSTKRQSNSAHIHNTLATRSTNRLGPNSVLGRIPPNVSDSETELSREDRVHLSRLRCGQHNALMSYRKKLHPETSDTCPLCDISTHIIHHILEECLSLDPLRHSRTQPLSTEDRPGPTVALLRSAGLLDQN